MQMLESYTGGGNYFPSPIDLQKKRLRLAASDA